jgi:hypothetical protein
MSISTGWNATVAANEPGGDGPMSRLRDILVLFGVACVVPGWSFLLGRAQGVPLPPPATAEMLRQGQEKNQEKPVKADAAKQQVRVDAKPAARAKAVMKAVAVQPARVVGRPAAVLDAQVTQYVQQFRPMFRAEYYFIRNTCDLNTDQRKQLARMGERVIKAAARQFAEAQQKMMRGGWRPGSESPDPRKFIEEELTRVLRPLLSLEQESQYEAELEMRTASRKQVVIDNVVAKLEADLVLTAEQRSKLIEALAVNWKDSWCQSLEMLMNIENFFPNIPDQVITPLLTDHQKEVWRRIPKNSNVFWGFNFGGAIMENDPLDDPELAEAQKEAVAGNKK